MKEEIGPYVISELDLRKFGLILLASYRKIGDSDYEPLQDMIQKIRSHPLSEEMLKKENLNVALVAAYEAGMKEGARKEREDVLDQVRDRCAEKMSDKNPSIDGVMLSYILADLRGGEL